MSAKYTDAQIQAKALEFQRFLALDDNRCTLTVMMLSVALRMEPAEVSRKIAELAEGKAQ